MGKRNKKIILTGEVSATDKRGHIVRKYQDTEGAWFVERNDNGAIHPEPCADEAAATELFTQYVELD